MLPSAERGMAAQRRTDAVLTPPNRSTNATVTEERRAHGVPDVSAMANPAVQLPAAPWLPRYWASNWKASHVDTDAGTAVVVVVGGGGSGTKDVVVVVV